MFYFFRYRRVRVLLSLLMALLTAMILFPVYAPMPLNQGVVKYRRLGHLQEAQQHYAQAEKLYRKASDEPGGSIRALRDLSRVLALQGNYREADRIAGIVTRYEQAPSQPRYLFLGSSVKIKLPF